MMGADNIIEFNDAITDLDRLIQNNQDDAWIDFPGAGQHNQYTVIKARRVLEGTLAELEGLLDGRANEPDIENLIAPGQFNVIDISELPSTGQRLVVSKIRRDVTQLLERNRAGVENAIFFADELNKFAPRNPRGQLARLKEELDDTAERGRAVGATLLGVEQYPSEISSAIIGNVATKAYSRLGRQEMKKSLYQGLTDQKKTTITRLQSGYMMVNHDRYQEPVLTRFPRPPCTQEAPKKYRVYNNVMREAPEKNQNIVGEILREDVVTEDDINTENVIAQLEEQMVTDDAIEKFRETVLEIE
jgi:DNA helicase HerA-like ATPase